MSSGRAPARDRRTCFSRWLGARGDALHRAAAGDVLRFRSGRLQQADRPMNTEHDAIAAARHALPVLLGAMHARAAAELLARMGGPYRSWEGAARGHR